MSKVVSNTLRLIGAALFVWIGLGVAVLVMFSVIPADFSPLLAGLGISLMLILLCIVAFILFNPSGTNWSGLKESGKEIRKLEEQGLLSSINFKAKRAFQVEEYEDEGLHFFIELEDSSVLYLSGQYLYDYEPIEDDPELAQPRRFPCTDFTIRRHRSQGFVVDVICRGCILEPELIARHFDKDDFRQDTVPEDGQIFTDRTYEDLKQERMRRKVTS